MVYAPDKFSKKGPILGEMPYSADECEEVECGSADRLILFTTKTCPKCMMAKTFLQKAGIEYETVVVDDTPELALEYGITEAPTLVVVTGDSVQKVANPSNIKLFCEHHAMV